MGGRAALTFRLVPGRSQNTLQWKHVSVTSRTPIGQNGGSCEGRGVSNPENIGSHGSERIENRTDPGDITMYASWRLGFPTYWLWEDADHRGIAVHTWLAWTRGCGQSSDCNHSRMCIHRGLYRGLVDRLVQNCSNSSALAMKLLQFCAKPLTWVEPTHWLSSGKQSFDIYVE